MFENLLNIIFKKKCFSCSKVEDYLCVDCFYRKLIMQKNCFLCDNKDNGSNLKNCKKCRDNIMLDGIISFFDYHDKDIRKMIHTFKFKSAFDIGKFLGKNIGDVINKKYNLDNNYVIIPVPISTKRFNFRGFNQSYIVANEMSKSSNLNVYFDVLLRKRDTIAQSKLKENDRKNNIKDAFFVKYDNILRYNLFDRNVILVDDVITTGNTASFCARELKKVGFKKIFIVTIART